MVTPQNNDESSEYRKQIGEHKTFILDTFFDYVSENIDIDKQKLKINEVLVAINPTLSKRLTVLKGLSSKQLTKANDVFKCLYRVITNFKRDENLFK